MPPMTLSPEPVSAVLSLPKGVPAAPGHVGFLHVLSKAAGEAVGQAHDSTDQKDGKKTGIDQQNTPGFVILSPAAVPKGDARPDGFPSHAPGPARGQSDVAHGGGAALMPKAAPTTEAPALTGQTPMRTTSKAEPEAMGKRIAEPKQGAATAVSHVAAPVKALGGAPDKQQMQGVPGNATGHAASSTKVTVIRPTDQAAPPGQPAMAQAVLAALQRDVPSPAKARTSSTDAKPGPFVPKVAASRATPRTVGASGVAHTKDVAPQASGSGQPVLPRNATARDTGDSAFSLPAGTTAPNSGIAAPAQPSPITQATSPSAFAGPAAGQMAATTQGQAAQGTAELLLHPVELGKVRMKFRHHDGIVTVSISAERPDTLQMLRSHVHLLAQEFTASGFAGSQFTFEGQGHGDRQSADNTGSGGAQPKVTEVTAAAPQMRSQGMIAGATLDLRL